MKPTSNRNIIKKRKQCIKEKHLTRRKKEKKKKKERKIMKTKHIRKDKSSCPKVKSIEEKRLAILKTSIIFFLQKTLQKARRHHLSHSWTLSATK
jgi:hypothetical protein